jgi:hypothetical protein
MALSWIKRPKRPVSVDDLISAGEYRKAIELLRKQFSQRYPSTTERQGYAELLVRAGRGAEAVPVLLGIADEQERYGFPDKALEALRCAAAIDPEQAEVKDRLDALAATPAPDPAVGPPSEEEDGHGPSDSWGVALDGAFRDEGQPQESAEGPEEVPGGVEEVVAALDEATEFAALDGEDSDPLETVAPGAATEVADAAPSHDGQDLVVVENEGEITATSIQVDPTVLGADESEPAASADDGEITARSLWVDPSVLGDEAKAAPGPEDGEITATSIPVEASVLGDEAKAAPGAEDGEITAKSIRVEASVLGAAEPESAGADPVVAGVGATGLEPAPDLLLPEDDLEPEEVEELTAEVEEPAAEVEEPAAEVEEPAAEVEQLTAEDELEAPPFHTGESREPHTVTDTGARLPGSAPDGDELRSLLTEQDLDAALATDAEALLSGGPTEDESGPPGDEDHLQELLAADARVLLSEHPTSDAAGALADLAQLDELLATDARALLSDGPTPDQRTPPAGAEIAPEAPAAESPGLPATSPGRAEPEPLPVDAPLADERRALLSEAPAPSAPVSLDQELAADARALLGQSPGDGEPEPAAVETEPAPPPADEAPDLPAGGHPDETHLFLSEGDLFGSLGEGPEPCSEKGESPDQVDRPTRALAETEEAIVREEVRSLLRKSGGLAARATPSVEEGAEGAGEEQGDHLAG